MEAASRLKAVDPDVGEARPEKRSSDPVPVSQAFSLGWNLSRLYLSGTAPRRRQRRSSPDRLPSPGRLSEAERCLIRLGQVKAAIDHLDDRLNAGDEGTLREVTDCHISELEPRDGAECNPKESLCEAHMALAHGLSAKDPRLAKAYHLGISLATTCYAPTDAASLKREFNRHRMAQLGEWLADLCSLFPEHSSRAVRLSCTAWRAWVFNPQVNPAAIGEDPGLVMRVRGKATNWTQPLDLDREWQVVRRALARQGEVWRALLSGEKPGTAMLELRDYVAAGARGLRNGYALLGRMWLLLSVLSLFVILGIATIVTFENTGAKVAGLVTVAGSLGFAWKGVLGGIGAVIAKFQRPVWGAALDEEIANAITILPAGAAPSTAGAPEAAPAAGPQPAMLPLLQEVDEHEEWAV